MSEITLVTACGYFQYFQIVLNNSKMEHDMMTNINSESIIKYSVNRNKVDVTIKPLVTITSLSTYLSFALTKIVWKNEVNTHQVDINQ